MCCEKGETVQFNNSIVFPQRLKRLCGEWFFPGGEQIYPGGAVVNGLALTGVQQSWILDCGMVEVPIT
jgi:hypothetical protein